jgi:hypothetical protein
LALIKKIGLEGTETETATARELLASVVAESFIFRRL